MYTESCDETCGKQNRKLMRSKERHIRVPPLSVSFPTRPAWCLRRHCSLHCIFHFFLRFEFELMTITVQNHHGVVQCSFHCMFAYRDDK
jgi:hypothetical protein